MTCEEFLDLLDGDLPFTEEAEAHRSACPACALAADREEAARRGLAAFRDVEPPGDLHGRILSASARPAAGRLWRRAAWAAPMAAVLLLALLGGVTLVRSFRSSFTSDEGLRRPTVMAPQPAVERSQTAAPMDQRSPSPEPETSPGRKESREGDNLLPPPPPRPAGVTGLEISPDLAEVHRKGEARDEGGGPTPYETPAEEQAPAKSSDRTREVAAAPPT
ncbi:MAG: hypothetical protein AB1824_04485, partial [Acidobacteriota bacterium]